MNTTTHHMHLNQNPFESILSGAKKIEVRINDEKRQEIKVGDEIEFTLRENPERKFIVKVIELLKFKSFQELYMSRPAEEFGGEDTNTLIDSIYKYYPKEDEIKFGVVGIKLEISI